MEPTAPKEKAFFPLSPFPSELWVPHRLLNKVSYTSSLTITFNNHINVMFVFLQPLVKRPGHDELRKALPMEFRDDFQECTVIIDCFEVFI